jgi:hypothetical protein
VPLRWRPRCALLQTQRPRTAPGQPSLRRIELGWLQIEIGVAER